MTRIVCISDSHCKHKQLDPLPDGDILIHAGDISMIGKIWKVESFLRWFDKQAFSNKIFVAGNHDWLFQKDPGLAQQLVNETDTVDYLQDSMIEREGLKIWGSPWSPRFYDWAFNMDQEERGRKWNLIPEDCDIVITHGPMYGIGDKAPRDNRKGYEHTGCKILYQTLVKKVRPALHVCGHIHSGFGVYETDGITSINASNLNEKYQCVNKPIVVDLINGKATIVDY